MFALSAHNIVRCSYSFLRLPDYEVSGYLSISSPPSFLMRLRSQSLISVQANPSIAVLINLRKRFAKSKIGLAYFAAGSRKRSIDDFHVQLLKLSTGPVQRLS